MAVSPDLRDEILDCLRRSGYLLESRIVHSLGSAGFFVEPNVAVVDRHTGKSREIDIVAEYYSPHPDQPNISVRTNFAIEAINNHLPLVLTTPYPGSPNVELVDPLYGTSPSPSPFEAHIDLYDDKGFEKEIRYSQYCAISRKKSGDELMASHPDDLYSSLLKLAEFTDQQVSEFNQRDWSTDDKYWRLWFWESILVVGGDLLVASEDSQGALSLTEIDRGSIIFNFHVGEDPHTVVIRVVRERQLMPYLSGVVSDDERLTLRLYKLRLSFDGASA